MKRCLSLLLTVILLFSLCTHASAAGTDIKSGAFYYQIKGNGTAVITGYDYRNHKGEDIYIPRMLDGYTVTEIGDEAFTQLQYDKNGVISHFTHLKVGSLTIPDTIVSIGARAFMGLEFSSKSITIPASVQYIGPGAFSYLGNVEQFVVANGNSVYATIDGILYNKVQKTLVAMPDLVSLDVLVIPEGIKAIDDYAFFGRWNGQWEVPFICLPSTLERIGDYAFAYAKMHISKIVNGRSTSRGYVPPSLKELGVGAFYNLQSFLTLHLDNTMITEIPAYTFYSVSSTDFTLPKNLEQIGPHAFEEAAISNDFVWPASLQEIDDYAFYDADLEACSLLEARSLTRIGDYAFAILCIDGSNLSFALPQGLEEIGDYAFAPYTGTNSVYLKRRIVAINIPASVISIGKDICDKYNVTVSVEPGTYGAMYASENGYNTQGAGNEDTSWLN